jgi:hypothetical protein
MLRNAGRSGRPAQRSQFSRRRSAIRAKRDRLVGEFLDDRELLVERLQLGEHGEKRFRRGRLNHETVPLLAHDRVLARKLELTGDADGLVAPAPEEPDASL